MFRFVVTLLVFWIAIFLAACGTITPRLHTNTALVAPTAALTITPHTQTIRDILKNPPAPGQSFQVDAYFSGAWHMYVWGHCPPPSAPGRLVCPSDCPAVELTEKPLRPYVQVLNTLWRNLPPHDSAYLLAVDAATKRWGPGATSELPFHARLQGHLGDPAFSKRPNAEHIFFVEQVVSVYPEKLTESDRKVQLPSDFAEWVTYQDPALGFSFRYPPGWTVEVSPESASETSLILHSPDWPEYPIFVRVYPTFALFAKRDPLVGGQWQHKPFQMSFEQGGDFSTNRPKTQRLTGHLWKSQETLTRPVLSAGFAGKKHYYALALRYPMGSEASQPLLTTYSAIVATFRLDPVP